MIVLAYDDEIDVDPAMGVVAGVVLVEEIDVVAMTLVRIPVTLGTVGARRRQGDLRGEKIENDNYLIHHLRVVDTKIKVLYVDNWPRWEYRFLKDGLIRDVETMLAHVINLDADSNTVQPYTKVPGWGPLQRFPKTREELFEYDVVIFGDVDPYELAREVRGKAEPVMREAGVL